MKAAPSETSWMPRVGAVLLPLFMMSGATSLVYETIWSRQLQFICGTSQLAISTLLAAFMAGLALGGLAGARWARIVRRPLIAYAALEGTIGVYALLFPFLLQAVQPIYLGFWKAVQPSPFTFAIFQFLLLGALLLPPTICMGATLPLLSRFVSASDSRSGKFVGRLYGANTVGAVIGIVLAGFVLLPKYGLSATSWMAAIANLALAGTAVLLSRHASSLTTELDVKPSPQPQGTQELDLRVLLAIAAIAGFTSLIYEVAWFRLMVLVLGGSVYAFSIMLLAFLSGIGIGGWASGGWADRAFAKGGVGRVLACLALVQAGIGVIAWLSMFAYNELPFAWVDLYIAFKTNVRMIWFGKVLLALAVMTPPAFLMGAAFPFLVRAASATIADTPRAVGRIYGFNTLGALLGAFLGGFMLLPALHVRNTVLCTATLNVAVCFFLIYPGWVRPKTQLSMRRFRVPAAAALVAILMQIVRPPWDPQMMASGLYQNVEVYSSVPRDLLRALLTQRSKLLFYEEGLCSVVTVGVEKDSGNTWLANNGKIDASSQVDLSTQVMVAHLPFVFKPDAQRVLVIGLASGISLGCVTLHDAPTQIDVVEIEPSIVEASHYFDAFNYRPLEDRRVNLFLNDGRNHLQLTPDGAYDIIQSEPPNPWLTGVANLFTRDFFELGKRKLAPGGVWGQWIQTYGLAPDDLRSLLATFCSVYPNVRLFRVGEADLCIVGSDNDLALDVDDIFRALGRNQRIPQSLHRINISNAETIVSQYLMDRPRILEMCGDIPFNTDDNMRIEHNAPFGVFQQLSPLNSRMLADMAQVPFEAVSTPAQTAALGEAYLRRRDFARAEAVTHHLRERYPDDPASSVLAQELRDIKSQIATAEASPPS